eukprot:696024_1
MESKVVWMHYIIFMCVVWVIFIPICIYYTRKFLKWRGATFIQKRNPLVVFIVIVCELLWIGLDRPLSLCRYACEYLEYHQCYHYTNTASPFVYALTIVTLVLSFTYRVWFIYYDVNYIKQAEAAKWKVLIISDADQAWFIRHKVDYGNRHFILYKVLFPMWVAIASFFVIEHLYIIVLNPALDFLAALIDSIIIMTIVTFGVFLLFCKTPTLHDAFAIQKEIKLVLLVLVLRIVGAIGLKYLFGAFIHNAFIINLSRAYLFTSAGLVVILLQTLYVFKALRVDSEPRLYNETSMNISMHSLSARSPSSQSGSAPPSPMSNARKLNLVDLLADDAHVELFINHLMKEFNMEVWISFVEFVRFQEHMIELFNLNPDDYYTYALCQSIPKATTIVNTSVEAIAAQALKRSSSNRFSGTYTEMDEKNEDESAQTTKIICGKSVARKLFVKYIQTGSEYEINISFDQRNQFEKMMTDYNEWLSMQHTPENLALLFKDISSELFKLLQYSFGRFKENLCLPNL